MSMAGGQNPASVVKGNGDPLANHAVAQQRGGGVVSLQASTLPACVFTLLVTAQSCSYGKEAAPIMFEV